MTNATNNNGDQPFSQQTRDTMAQNDHDKLIEYGVMLQTILTGLTRQEQLIKDLISGQATALAAWEVKSDSVHESHNVRIKKIEELALIWVPKAIVMESDIEKIKTDIQVFKDADNKFLGGWKTLVFIGVSIVGILGFIISIINIFQAAHK